MFCLKVPGTGLPRSFQEFRMFQSMLFFLPQKTVPEVHGDFESERLSVCCCPFSVGLLFLEEGINFITKTFTTFVTIRKEICHLEFTLGAFLMLERGRWGNGERGNASENFSALSWPFRKRTFTLKISENPLNISENLSELFGPLPLCPLPHLPLYDHVTCSSMFWHLSRRGHFGGVADLVLKLIEAHLLQSTWDHVQKPLCCEAARALTRSMACHS